MIRYGCLFTRDGVAVGVVKPHRERKAAVEEAVALAVAEGQKEDEVRAWLTNDDVAPWCWEVDGVTEDTDETMQELMHDDCALQIIRIGAEPPLEDVETRIRVAESPALRSEPPLSDRSQDRLERHGLSP